MEKAGRRKVIKRAKRERGKVEKYITEGKEEVDKRRKDDTGAGKKWRIEYKARN